MSGVKMIVSAMTDVGRARETNEDAWSIIDLASGKKIDAVREDLTIDVQERGVLLALSDGMGGAEAGEVASALVLESLEKALEREAKGAIHEQLESAVQRANRNVFFEVEGHTDAAGDESWNQKLGEDRAMAVRTYLHDQHNIPLSRIEIISYGESKPVADNKTRDGRAQNRRVVIKVVE